jgi:hypothetical protein
MRAEVKPVTPTAPTPPAPVTPAPTPTPVKPVKPVEVKPEVDRTTQINQNLTEGFNNNPSLFANYDTYKKAY